MERRDVLDVKAPAKGFLKVWFHLSKLLSAVYDLEQVTQAWALSSTSGVVQPLEAFENYFP